VERQKRREEKRKEERRGEEVLLAILNLYDMFSVVACCNLHCQRQQEYAGSLKILVKVKLKLYQAMEAHKAVRPRSSHIF
jgi:hypothetical protein